MTEYEQTLEGQLESIAQGVASGIKLVNDIPRLAESRQSDINRVLRGAQYRAEGAVALAKELRGTLPVKRIDIDRSIEKLTEQAAKYEAWVLDHTSKGLSYVIESHVNATVARQLRETVEALEATRDHEPNQPWVKDPETGDRSRSISSEEWLESMSEHYQQVVFDFVNRLHSRSTSESSRIQEQVKAQAATEMLEAFGTAPRNAYGHTLIVWKSDES